MASKNLFILLAAAACSVTEGAAEPKSLSAMWTDFRHYEVVEGIRPDAIVTATFTDSIDDTGWSVLEIHDTRDKRNQSLTRPDDDTVAFFAGALEANLTSRLMDQHWKNTMGQYCQENREICSKVFEFYLENSQYNGDEKYLTDSRLYQYRLFQLQMLGLSSGYHGDTLDDSSMVFFQLHGDFDDLVAAINANSSSHSGSTHSPGSGSCSALIKLLPDNSDLLIGHNTWTSYFNMMRIFKLYDLKYQRSGIDKTVIPGHAIAFPSYPGRLYSGDDFYLISTGLITMETSIENTNINLWKQVTPACILENVRAMTANRLATSGKEWTDIFRMDNSGTYNNQWMILDQKLFTSGQPLKDGLLWVLEQMPGHVLAQDLTAMLRQKSYWASYNIPYYKDIYHLSGTDLLAMKYGDWFTWDKNPRAKIFARDHSHVTDLASLSKLMKYNDFQHDEWSVCNCTPPYSAENAIAARSDLNPANGTYPFSALGHRLHGAIDTKVTSVLTLRKDSLSCTASSGPTSSQQPPFQWSTSGNPSGAPPGHPDKWNFQDVHVQWDI